MIRVVDQELSEALISGKEHLELGIADGIGGTRAISKVASVKVAARDSVPREFETVPIDVAFPVYRNPPPFPFDNHIAVLSFGGFRRPFDVVLEKRFSGWLFRATSSPDIVRIALYRPRLQQVFMVTTSFIFVAIVSLLTVKLHSSPRPLGGVEELAAIAGVFLGAAGFREIVGVAREPGFTALDVIIVGVPLLFLASGALRELRSSEEHQKRQPPSA